MSGARRRGPSRDELLEAVDRRVEPVVAPGLRVLFCGINPGLYTAWAGHHFARPGNRFWPALHRSGFTPRLFDPAEQDLLLDLGLGITNVVDRASATAAELQPGRARRRGRAARGFRTPVAAGVPRGAGCHGLPGCLRRAEGRGRAAAARPRRHRGLGAAEPQRAERALDPAGLAEVFAELREEVDQRLGSRPA